MPTRFAMLATRPALTGKWHLKNTPEQCGFDFASTCWSNGTWYDREFTIDGEPKVMPGFVDDVTADESIRFIRQHKQQRQAVRAVDVYASATHGSPAYTWPAKKSS